MANSDVRSEELLALKSIFDESVLTVDSEGDLPAGRFLIQPSLPQSFHIHYMKHGDLESEEYAKLLGNMSVEYLPPLNLHFQLPETYPSTTGPAFLLSCMWLTVPQLSALCSKLDKLREESGDVVLYTWIQFLQEESLSYLNIENSLDITELLTENRSRKGYSHRRSRGNDKSDSLEKGELLSDKSQDNVKKSCDILIPKKYMCSNVKEIKSEQKQCEDTSCSNQINIERTGKTPFSAQEQHSNDADFHISYKPAVNRGSDNVDCRVVSDVTVGTNIILLLFEYNKLKKQEFFNNQWYTCKICFNKKQGAKFLVFHGCNHMFCKECMHSYFSIQICDGNAHVLTCPETKCSTQALPSQVKEVVGAELYADYDAKLLATTLDSMSDIAYCPRIHCQCPTLIDRESNMAICPFCKFAFCIYCKMAFHGISPCRFKKEERKKIREEYLNADPEKKKEMEKRFGRRSLQMLVDDSLSEDWIDSFSKKCPHCSAAIEKSDGCNKMICWKCGTNFCWLCMTNLKASNPYQHFTEASSPCFKQLFYGMTIDFEEDDGVEFGEFL